MIELKDLKRFTDEKSYERLQDGGDFEMYLAEQVRSFLNQNFAVACEVKVK